MKRLIAVILIIVILVISGYVIYNTLNVIKPAGPPAPTVFGYSEDYWRGKYLFSMFSAEAGKLTGEASLVIMDYQGNYLIYDRSTRANFFYPYQLSENEIFYYLMDRLNFSAIPEARIWNWHTGATRIILEEINLRGHHKLLIEDGYFVTLRRVEENIHGLDTIVNIDPETGNETWIWSSEPLFPERPCSWCPDDDWTHANDVTISLDGRYYYINFRNPDSFAKINRETKELEWICGRNGNFTLLENGVEKESLWYHSHIIKEIRPNVFLMFDNDFHNRTHIDVYPSGEDPFEVNYGGQSRLIEITLDESTMTAKVTWSYEPSAEYFSAIWGDIDVLPNGNVVGVFGTPTHSWTANHEEIEEPFGAAILEVNREGELVREYRFPYGYCIYQIEQLSKDPADYKGRAWLLKLP
jgi:hypothetical protein